MLADEIELGEAGYVNIVGGCCGTSPDHIAAIARASHRSRPRAIPAIEKPAPVRTGAVQRHPESLS